MLQLRKPRDYNYFRQQQKSRIFWLIFTPGVCRVHDVISNGNYSLALLPHDDESLELVNHAGKLHNVPLVHHELLGLGHEHGVPLVDNLLLPGRIEDFLIAPVAGVVVVILLVTIVVIVSVILIIVGGIKGWNSWKEEKTLKKWKNEKCLNHVCGRGRQETQ